MSISVSSRKQKGRKLQQWVATKISKLLGISIKKDGDIESRPMGMSGTDVILRGKALERFKFSVEAKAQESFAIPAWIKQAKTNIIEGTDWLLVCKRNREEPIVIMDAEAFFRLCKKAIGKGE
jgi:hypothetical protein